MKLIGYIRGSKDAQQLTLAVQKDKLEKYCELHDYELIDIITESKSAETYAKREKLKGVMARLEAGEFDGLIVCKLDRLTRCLFDWCKLLDGPLKGRELVSCMDNIDTSNAMGNMMVGMIIMMAQWERETISERTKAALDQKRGRGEYIGGRPRYGYNIVERNHVKYLEPNIAEQQIITIAQDYFNKGRHVTYYQTWEYLKRRGFKSRVGNVIGREQVRRMIMDH